jgi:cell division septum initiation protein DivIVA
MEFDQLLKFIDLVQNSEKYKAALQKLNDQKKEVQDMINVAGKAQDISRLHEKAEEAVEKAKNEAKDIVAKAQASASKVLADARAMEQAIVDQKVSVETAKNEARVAKTQAEETIKAYDNQLAMLQKRITAVTEKELELAKQQQEINDKVAKLRSLGL